MMLSNLAAVLHRHRRLILAVAVLAVAVAGTFGASVSKHLSPYSANDPATQSVQATNRYQAATGRQIVPGIVALVQSAAGLGLAAQRELACAGEERREHLVPQDDERRSWEEPGSGARRGPC